MRNRMPIQTRRPLGIKRPFPPRRDYSSLSIKDLIDARDAYQTYLSTLDNVFAIAIGRYLIHEGDWYAEHPPDVLRPKNVPLIDAAHPNELCDSAMVVAFCSSAGEVGRSEKDRE